MATNDRERERRACLHRQIGAIESRLNRGEKPSTRKGWIQRAKLQNKLKGLKAELNQVPLFGREAW